MDNCESLFKVIIVHEDTVAGLQAANVLQQLAAQLENKLGMDINPWEICSHVWQFEWLQDPKLCEQAVTESTKADMIIIATDGSNELPAYVRGWIESVLPRKQGAATALVALLGQKTSNVSSPPARYLRQLATQYGVDFMSNASGRPAGVETDVQPIISRLEINPAFLETALPHPNSMHGCGVND